MTDHDPMAELTDHDHRSMDQGDTIDQARLSVFGEPTNADRARWDVHAHVEKLARTMYGADTVQRPAGNGAHFSDVDALAGLQAARFIADHARGYARDYARYARGNGASWDDVAGALGYSTDDDARELDAFDYVKGTGTYAGDSVGWRCWTCTGLVNDYGPHAGHPDDTERGHAPDCARHAAAVGKYRSVHGLED